MNINGATSSAVQSSTNRPSAVTSDTFYKITIRPESMRQLSQAEIEVFKKQEEASSAANDPNFKLDHADNDPENLWGEIVIGGETVAQIFKSGLVVSKQGFELPRDVYMQTAEERASQFLKQFGGSLEPGRPSKSYYL